MQLLLPLKRERKNGKIFFLEGKLNFGSFILKVKRKIFPKIYPRHRRLLLCYFEVCKFIPFTPKFEARERERRWQEWGGKKLKVSQDVPSTSLQEEKNSITTKNSPAWFVITGLYDSGVYYKVESTKLVEVQHRPFDLVYNLCTMYVQPNQQRTPNKLPTDLWCRNFVNKHRQSIEIGAKCAKMCVQYVHIPTELPFCTAPLAVVLYWHRGSLPRSMLGSNTRRGRESVLYHRGRSKPSWGGWEAGLEDNHTPPPRQLSGGCSSNKLGERKWMCLFFVGFLISLV